MSDQLSGDEMICLFSRLSGHNIEFSFFVSERECGQDIGTDADAEHENVRERERDLDDDESEERDDFRDVRCEQIHDCLLQVIENLSAFLHTNDNRSEVVVK